MVLVLIMVIHCGYLVYTIHYVRIKIDVDCTMMFMELVFPHQLLPLPPSILPKSSQNKKMTTLSTHFNRN